ACLSREGYCVPLTLSMQRRTASERVASRLPSTGVTLPPSASIAACSWNFVTCLRESVGLARGRDASSRRANSRSRSWPFFAPATGTLAVSARSCASQSRQSSVLSARAGTGASESNDAAVIAATVRAAIGVLLPADLAASGAVPVTVDGDDAPLGLREPGPRADVLDAPADGGLVGRHVGAAEQHAAEALAAVGLPAGGAGRPRGACQERVRDPMIAPPRPPREDGAAALADRGLGTRLGLGRDRRLLLAPHTAAVEA